MPAPVIQSADTIGSDSTRHLRAFVACALACSVAIFAFAGAMGVGLWWPLSALVSAVIAGGVGLIVWQRPLLPLEEGACSRALKIVSGLATIAALVQLIRLCVFIVDPSQVACALGASRGLGLLPSHSCVSAYFVAGQAIDSTPNVYDDALYSLPRATPAARRTPRPIGSFNIDAYEYPPPFLVLTRALGKLAPDFLHFRMLWFGLTGAVTLIGLLAVVRFLGPVAGTRALLLSPLVWAADPTLGTLQTGNVQPMVMAVAMLAMVCFDRRRDAAGGALLGYITVSKLFPGLLVLYLLVRREWRAVAWTVAASAVLLAISLLDTGWAPYDAFLRHLPGLMSGEAFPAFRNPGAVAKNYSVPGMVFKLGLYGVPGMSFGAAKILGWIYTLIIVPITILVARRTLTRDEKPLVWLTILILATLRSPFLPSYAMIPPLWLLTLLAATAAPTPKTLGVTLGAWLVLSFPLSQSADPKLMSLIILMPQAVTVALMFLVLRNVMFRELVGDERASSAAAATEGRARLTYRELG